MYDLKVREHFPCFAQTKRGGCKALERKYDCETCNFYKPIRDHELDQERALKRLKSLDKPIRLNIAEKYNIKEIV
jgi:hypothetical protein